MNLLFITNTAEGNEYYYYYYIEIINKNCIIIILCCFTIIQHITRCGVPGY